MSTTDAGRFPEAYIQTVRQALAFLSGVFTRNILLIAGIVVLATAAGAAVWYARKPYYESDLVCAYNNQRYPRKTFGEMAHKLDVLAKSGAPVGLARLLGISPRNAASIVGVDAKNRAGSPLHEDITEDYQPLYFTVRAKDRNIFPAVESGLLAYLNGTPQQRLLGELSVANLQLRIAILEADLRKTDSVLDAYNVAIRSGAILRDTASGRSEVTDVLRYRNEIEDKLIAAEFKKNLEQGNSVVVMHGFAPPDQPTRGSRKMIAAAALLGFIAAYCWALLRDKQSSPAHG